MIIEGAIGDAYGAGFEFADMEFIKNKNQLTHYQQHPLFESIYKKYTDDTQMALAIAELLIEKTAWTPVAIADKFVEVFKRDPRQGYALGWQGEVGIDAVQTVHAVFTVLSEAHSFSEILKKSVDLGGDVDTVASLALALAAVDKNMENDLPRWLYEELENEQFGRDYILKIDNELFKLKDAVSIA